MASCRLLLAAVLCICVSSSLSQEKSTKKDASATTPKTTTTTDFDFVIGGSTNRVNMDDDELFKMSDDADKSGKPIGGNFDKYVDIALPNFRTMMKETNFDPLPLGEILVCNNCTMTGLSGIERTGESRIEYSNLTVTVDIEVGFPKLFVSCFCNQRVLVLSFAGVLEVTIYGLNVHVQFIQQTVRGASPKMSKYDVLKEGSFEVDLKGRGLLGPVTEVAFRVLFRRQVGQVIREYVYEKAPNIIREKLKEITLPIGRR